jgi:hypothetical protein
LHPALKHSPEKENAIVEAIDLVGRDGETSGFRDLCVRRVLPFGGADAMKEVVVFIGLRILCCSI